MKNVTTAILCLALLSTLLLPAEAQGSSVNSFTYQGRLNDTNGPAAGLYDFSFALFPASTGGSQIGTTIMRALMPVTNGLFTIPLEFLDVDSFSGADRWLEIAVHPSGVGTNITLSPRQQITAAPYAIRAAGLAGTLPLAQLPAGVVTNGASEANLGGTFNGNGTGVTNVNAASLNGVGSAGFWRTSGNAGANPANGAFLGTPDYQALEFRVNNERAMRYEPDVFCPNLIGGHSENLATPGISGGTIGGGGNFSGPNQVGGDFATVVGGLGNSANGFASVAMGRTTLASGDYATALGKDTIAAGALSVAAGFVARANHQGSFVWADSFSTIPFASTASNQFLVRASGGVGINTTNPGAMLQLGDTGVPNSQGMIRLASRSGTGSAFRTWDIGVPETDQVVTGKGYSFVIDDLLNGTGPEVMVQYGTGNVGIGTTNPTAKLDINGAYLRVAGSGNEQAYIGGDGLGGDIEIGSRSAGIMTAGFWNSAASSHMNVVALSFVPTSDRNQKENIEPVDPKAVLAKVAALPISQWNFKAMPAEAHIGPMAQDFYLAFGVGPDDKHIATVDADGVALAAIQGLNQKVEQKNAEIAELKHELEMLKQVVDKLANAKN